MIGAPQKIRRASGDVAVLDGRDFDVDVDAVEEAPEMRSR
jgi:hypothetical protein